MSFQNAKNIKAALFEQNQVSFIKKLLDLSFRVSFIKEKGVKVLIYINFKNPLEVIRFFYRSTCRF